MLQSINATALKSSDDGPDIEQWFHVGVPGGSLYNADDLYFDYHHTEADTPALISPEDLDKATAVWTAMSYVLAQITTRLDHDPPVEERAAL